MKFLNGELYVEVKDHRYRIHPTSLRTQFQVQNDTQIRRNQLIVKNYPKNKNKHPIIQKQLPNCPSCTRNNWLEFDKGYYC